MEPGTIVKRHDDYPCGFRVTEENKSPNLLVIAELERDGDPVKLEMAKNLKGFSFAG